MTTLQYLNHLSAILNVIAYCTTFTLGVILTIDIVRDSLKEMQS